MPLSGVAAITAAEARTARKRKAAELAALSAFQSEASGFGGRMLMLGVIDAGLSRGKRTDRNVKRIDFNQKYMCMSHRRFWRRFRMTQRSFMKLADRLRGVLRTECAPNRGVRQVGGAVVTVECQLAASLRFFAGGAAVDIADIFDLSEENTLYAIVWKVVDAINACPDMKRAFDPENLPMVQEMADLFHAKSKNKPCMYGTVLAVDGIHIKIVRPGASDTRDSDRYYVDRKGCYAWNGQAAVDAHKRFREWDLTNPGQAADSRAYEESHMKAKCDRLPKGYHNVGDAAYRLTEKMMPPYRGNMGAWTATYGPEEAARRSNYNFFQSQQRITVECAFGELVLRWGILWRPLRVAFRRQTPLINCLFLLHNYCVDERLLRMGLSTGVLAEYGPGDFEDKEHRVMQQCKETRFNKNEENVPDFPALNTHRAPVDLLTGCEKDEECQEEHSVTELAGAELQAYERASHVRDGLALDIARKGYQRPATSKHNRV